MGKPKMNRSAKGGARSSLRFEDEGVLIHPPHQGDCGWHGTEGQPVTSGELAESPGGTGVNGPISVSERASDALPVVGGDSHCGNCPGLRLTARADPGLETRRARLPTNC